MTGTMGYKSPKRRDAHEEWGVEHVDPSAIWKGLPLKDGPLQEKNGNGPKEKKERKKAQQASLAEINGGKIHRPKKWQNGASLTSPYHSSKMTSMGEGDSDLIDEQNGTKVSSSGRNGMG